VKFIIRTSLALTLTATLGMALAAESPVVDLGTTVTGNQEQPRVITIVPWQATESAQGLRRYVYGERETLLQPIERHSFRRQLDMLESLRDPIDSSTSTARNR
jgi:hypothetical protein